MPSQVLDLSVVIPFKDHSDLTVACLDTLMKYSKAIKEVLLVSNNSSDEELRIVEDAAAKYKNARVLVYNHPFNFQKINNWAVEYATGSVYLFLNNDIELIPQSKSLIEKMYNKSLQSDVGAVGAVLLYEDRKTIQHAGVYLVPGGTADHLYIGKKLSSVENKIKSGEYSFDITKDMVVSAVTAAAVMVRKEVFNQTKGFNEDFIICGGDVDLCLRLMRGGRQNILMGTENGYMIHKESKTRSLSNVPYVDFIESYKSYIQSFDIAHGDKLMNQERMPHD